MTGARGQKYSDPREDYMLDAGGGVLDPPDPQGSEFSDPENQGNP